MGWYTGYLDLPGQVTTYSWTTIILLGFELFYITFQAARGQLSHYNVSSSLHTSLTAAVAFAAIAATLYTGYIGVLFCAGKFPELPSYYLGAIRIGVFLFVIFAFEGAIMGANGSAFNQLRHIKNLSMPDMRKKVKTTREGQSLRQRISFC